MNKNKTLIVTGCDSAHYQLAEDLIQSYRQYYKDTFDLAFINFLGEPAPAAIRSKVSMFQDYPGLNRFDKTLGYFTGFSGLKARLPELLPGYDCYCWVDADCWFQNAESLPRILKCADQVDICIHPEYDIHYLTHPTPNPRTLKIYRTNEAARLDQMPLNMPMLNSGVFAMRTGSKIWGAWKREMEILLDRHNAGETIFFSDQIPLHKTIFKNNSLVYPIRAIDNWQVYACRPIIDGKTNRLRTPTPPSDEIGLIHLAGTMKNDLALRYRAMSKLFDEAKG